jgi:hypothetical protein
MTPEVNCLLDVRGHQHGHEGKECPRGGGRARRVGPRIVNVHLADRQQRHETDGQLDKFCPLHDRHAITWALGFTIWRGANG